MTDGTVGTKHFDNRNQADASARQIVRKVQTDNRYMVLAWSVRDGQLIFAGHVMHDFPTDDCEEALAQARSHFIELGFMPDGGDLPEAELKEAELEEATPKRPESPRPHPVAFNPMDDMSKSAIETQIENQIEEQAIERQIEEQDAR